MTRAVTRRAAAFLFLLAPPARAQPADPDPDPVATPDETIVITAARPVATSAAAQAELDEREVASTPARAVDQVLASRPELTMPRADSQVLNPTGQGVSLRGLGAGRTLVLLDGVPLNDPFGGWIQWAKAPPGEIDRIDIVRGASANAYGSLGMAGVIQIETRPLDQAQLSIDADDGSRNSPHVAAAANGPVGAGVSLGASADAYRTDGYSVVTPSQRGPVDVRSPYSSESGALRAAWRGGRWSARAGASYFEDRASGGTALTPNSRRSVDASIGAARDDADGRLEILAYAGHQRFDNDNSTISADRTMETRALAQDIPVTDAGGSVVWTRHLTAHQSVVAGTDVRWVRGANDERVFDASGASLGTRSSGGHQLVGGVFAAWAARPASWLTVGAGARGDVWFNRGELSPIGGPSMDLGARHQGAFDPRVSASAQLARGLVLRAAGYTGFRTPNLNELYRGYISGGVTIEPNASLGAEHLIGGEVGVDAAPIAGLRLSATGFYDHTSGLIEQVSIDAAHAQRQNIAAARSDGVELEATYALAARLRIDAGYALQLTRVLAFPTSPAQVGARLTDLPTHAATLGVAWDDPTRISARARVRAQSHAWDDTANTLALPAFAEVDLEISHDLRAGVTAFAAGSNVLNETILTAHTASLERIGEPRTLWVGVRARLR